MTKSLYSVRLWLSRLRIVLTSINYRSKRFASVALFSVILLILLVIGYRFLFPSTPLSTVDVHPFESVAEYEAFVDANPFFNMSVSEDRLFTKTESVRDDKVAEYVIRLSERPLKPSMDKAYRENYISYLEHSQKQALEWIKSEGLNPDELHIIWRPDPVVMRTKLLGETTRPIPQKDNQTPITTPSPTATPNPSPESGVTPPSGRFPQ